MEKQLEILKALLEGKKVYDSEGEGYRLLGPQTVRLVRESATSSYSLSLLDQFTLTPPHKPLTFERIRKECVPMKHLLVDGTGRKRLYLGFNREGKLVTDFFDSLGCCAWGEPRIANWTIEEYREE